MMRIFTRRFVTVCFLLFIVNNIHAQTQEDFNTKLADVYTNAADQKKH